MTHKLLWYGLVATAGLFIGWRLQLDPGRATILLLILAATPIYAFLDTYVMYPKTGREWGFKFFLLGCYAELYVVIVCAELMALALSQMTSP